MVSQARTGRQAGFALAEEKSKMPRGAFAAPEGPQQHDPQDHMLVDIPPLRAQNVATPTVRTLPVPYR